MTRLPFSGDGVCAAFPEFSVTTPEEGSGGDKVAYKATRDDDDLALKIILSPVEDDVDEFDPDMSTERFRRELRGLSLVQSKHIIRVVDEPQLRVIEDANYIWYTEPYLAGGSLKSRLKAEGRLDPTEVHRLAQALLEAVRVMWAEGRFVHRDLKPGNICFLEDGTPVVIDLGIALFKDMSPITNSGSLGPGTDGYAAPEQYSIRRGTDLDFRTDLFLVGIVLLEALHGSHPLPKGMNIIDFAENFSRDSIANMTLTDGLRRILPRLLARHPSRRYPSVEKAITTLGSAEA